MVSLVFWLNIVKFSDLRQEMMRQQPVNKLQQPREEDLQQAANENAERAKKEAAVDSNKLIDNEFVTPNTTPSKSEFGAITKSPSLPSSFNMMSQKYFA